MNRDRASALAEQLDVRSERHDDVWTVRVSGELDAAASPLLLRELRQAVEAALPVVIDLRPCGFLDSMGLGSIIRVRNQLEKVTGTGRPLAIVANDGQVRRLLRLTSIDRMVPVTETPQEARELLAAPAGGRDDGGGDGGGESAR